MRDILTTKICVCPHNILQPNAWVDNCNSVRLSLVTRTDFFPSSAGYIHITQVIS